MSSMFWGLRLEPGKRYTATVDKPFHVSMAALDCTSVGTDEIQTVMLEEESNIPFILCNLQRHKVLQARLDLNFVSGNRVTFFCRGSGAVHLTGYVLPEDDEDYAFEEGEEEEDDEQVEEEEEDDDEEEDEEEDVEEKDLKEPPQKSGKKKSKLNGLANKRKPEANIGLPDSKKKKSSLQKKGNESDNDSDEDVEPEEEEAEDFDEGEEEEGQEIESEDEADESEEMEEVTPVKEKKSRKKKKNKQNLGSPQQQQGKQKQQSTSNGSPQDVIVQQKKKVKLESGNEKPTEPSNKSLDLGVTIKDIRLGNGPLCKPGKQVTVYYTGRLKSTNKLFDQTQHGPGFRFRLGRGEVIKGWDVGLVGMKVGGKRKITCPPGAAYGKEGSLPAIPPNSTLVFDVEVKAVN